MSMFHKSAHRILRNGARSSAPIHHLTGISKENFQSPTPDPPGHLQLPKGEFTPHMHQPSKIQKALKKCRQCPPCSHPTAPLRFHPLLSHICEACKLIFKPIVVASEEQVLLPEPKANHSWHFSPEELFVKYFASCLSLKHTSGEKFPLAFDEYVAPHRCDHRRFSTPKKRAEPTSPAGEQEHISTNFFMDVISINTGQPFSLKQHSQGQKTFTADL